MVIQEEKTKLNILVPSSFDSDRTAVIKLSFSDDFLPDDSGLFSSSAARAALALSLSSANEELIRQNLSALGYGDIMTAAFDNDEEDKTGMCIASRKTDDGIEIAAVLKGTSGREWYSNFDIGYTAEHRGFATAADFAEMKLGDYVFTRAIGVEPRFFITGYSRGGAAANILAKRLCDRYGTDRVFAYTYASPATTISRRVNRYSCIFNLVRDEDFFTRVPPEGWGYTRYGKTVSMSDIGDITPVYRTLTGEEYIGFTGREEVNSFLCAVMKLAPNVHAYYKRRRQVGDRRLSLYEFMRSTADMLSDNMDESAADVFLSAMVSEYADIISFLSSGADLYEIIGSAGGAPRCSVSDSHSPAAYIASLELLLA